MPNQISDKVEDDNEIWNEILPMLSDNDSRCAKKSEILRKWLNSIFNKYKVNAELRGCNYSRYVSVNPKYDFREAVIGRGFFIKIFFKILPEFLSTKFCKIFKHLFYITSPYDCFIKTVAARWLKPHNKSIFLSTMINLYS